MNITASISPNGVFVFNIATLESLKNAARANLMRRARICLHSNLESPVQEMIIALCSDSIIEPHRHPANKPESYHLIDGEMDVNIFDESGNVIECIHLRHGHASMYRIDGNVWHQPIAVSECAVYHEVYTGPFNKDEDVFYNNWASK